MLNFEIGIRTARKPTSKWDGLKLWRTAPNTMDDAMFNTNLDR